MKESTKQEGKSTEKGQFTSDIEEILRIGAKKMLQAAIESEVADYIDAHSHLIDEDGKRQVVRNGYLPERNIVTGLGEIAVKQPRVDDRKIADLQEEQRFTSKILPPYLRRIPSIDNLLPVLYLKGISTGDFSTALSAILGDSVKGLSATNIVRLKSLWEDEWKEWSKRDLSDKKYVYIWADGVYFNVRLDDERVCVLVIIAADSEGNKELLAIGDGYRESKLSWKEILLDLKERGLVIDPSLAIADGALGFWSALREVFPKTREQRCWVHKIANILDKLPKSMQSKAKAMIHEMYMAETKESALKAYNHFINTFEEKYPKAVACLKKDKDQLFTFYDFPAVHWCHLRTTNPIESTFATLRLRTKKTKGNGSRTATLTMVFKLALEAQKTWRKLRGYNMIPLVLQGEEFVDGVLKKAS